MKKWKHDKAIVPYKNIDSLVEFYGLSQEVREAISQVSKQSYLSGSRSIFEIYKCKKCGNLPCWCKRETHEFDKSDLFF